MVRVNGEYLFLAIYPPNQQVFAPNHNIANGSIFGGGRPGEYEGVCLNPKDIPPDDLDDVILGRMIKEARMFYELALKREQ